jgi:hypothetical protein
VTAPGGWGCRLLKNESNSAGGSLKLILKTARTIPRDGAQNMEEQKCLSSAIYLKQLLKATEEEVN